MVWGGSITDADARVLTEAVMDEVRQWQNRPLESLYPIMYVDCLVIKIRENQRILNKAVYLVLGITLEGQKEPASACGSQKTKGPAFWLSVCTELRNRGMRRLLSCLRGWPHWTARGHSCGLWTYSSSTVYGPAFCAIR